MGVVLAPIVDGKLEAWKNWTRELGGSSSNEWEDFNKRYRLTRHAAWLTETPTGPAVIALHQGPGSDDFIPKLAGSNNEFDREFKERLKEFHGMDVTQPPPGPLPELYLDGGS